MASENTPLRCGNCTRVLLADGTHPDPFCSPWPGEVVQTLLETRAHHVRMAVADERARCVALIEAAAKDHANAEELATREHRLNGAMWNNGARQALRDVVRSLIDPSIAPSVSAPQTPSTKGDSDE